MTRALRNPLALIGRKTGDQSAAPITDEKALASVMEQLARKASDLRGPYERRWFENLCYAVGEHYAQWDDQNKALQMTPAPPWRVRQKVNLIGAAIQRIIAKVTSKRARPEAIPATPDHKDQRKALLAQQVLDAKTESMGLEVFDQEWLLKTLLYSRAYLKVFWDSQQGEEIAFDADTEGGDVQSVEKTYEGDIGVAVDDPTTLFIEPGVSDFKQATWAMCEKLLPRGLAMDMFEEVADRISANTGKTSQAAPGGILDQFRRMLDGDRNTTIDHVVVRELWVRPDKRAKDEWRRKGCWLVMVDDVLAKGPEPFPYDNGKLPWVEMTDAFLNGLSAFGPTTVNQWVPANAMYNRLESCLMENLQTCSKPKLITYKGSGIKPSDITSEPAQVLEVNAAPDANTKLHYLHVPDPNAPSYDSLANRQLSDFENLSGQHEVSRGVAPGGVTAGVAIEALQNADDTVLRPLADCFRVGKTEVYRRILDLYIQFSQDDTRSAVLYRGQKATPSIVKFTGADIDYYDLRIEPNSLRPTTPLALREYIFRLASAGLFGPYQSPDHAEMAKKVIRSLQTGDALQIYEEANKDVERADWENDRLDEVVALTQQFDPKLQRYVDVPVMDEPIVPNPFDNHREHIERHQIRQKDLSFNQLPEPAQRAHLWHTESHKAALVETGQEPTQQKIDLLQSGMIQPASAAMAAEANPQLNEAMAASGGGATVDTGEANPPAPETLQGPEAPIES